MKTGSHPQISKILMMKNEGNQIINNQDRNILNQQVQPNYSQGYPGGSYNMMPQMQQFDTSMQMPNNYVPHPQNNQMSYPMSNQMPMYPMGNPYMAGFVPAQMPPQYLNNQNMNK